MPCQPDTNEHRPKLKARTLPFNVCVARSVNKPELARVPVAQKAMQVEWDSRQERVRCERLLRLGALILERRPWPEAPDTAVQSAWRQGLKAMGLAALPWDPPTSPAPP